MESRTKPLRVEVIPDNIPASLKALDRWIGWSWRLRNEDWDKPPLRIDNGKSAKSTDSSTWTTFDKAIKAHLRGDFDGIGITFGDCGNGKNLAGVDLDDVIEDGQLASWAAWVVARMDTYCEISPSGKGVKLFCWGTLPRGKRNDAAGRGVEMYDSGRYFTVTGRRYPETPAEVADRESVLFQIHPELLGESPVFGVRDPSKTDRDWALEYLKFILPARADNYQDWLAVGMALKSVAEDLVDAWDEWSKSSSKYKAGACHEKWKSFNGRSGGLTIKSLSHWGKEGGWQSGAKNGKTSSGLNGNAKPEQAKNESAKSKRSNISDNIPVDPLNWLRHYGVEVDKVVKIGNKEGVYDLVLNGGNTVQIGSVANILTPRTVQEAIADATRVVIPELKRPDWRCIGAELIRIAEHEDIGSDPQSELRDWICHFVDAHAHGDAASEIDIINGVNTSGIARTETGIIYIGLTKFLNIISGLNPIKITRNDLIQRLYREGFKRTMQQARDGDKTRKARTWESQKGYNEKIQS